MALPFYSGKSKKQDQLLAIDLGGRTTKAIHVQRKGAGFALQRYALVDAPIYEKNISVDLLSEHLKAVSQALGTKTRLVALAIGVSDTVVRHAEMPPIPVSDMRQVLKNNAKAYLQQDLPNHIFDCYVLPQRQAGNAPEKAKDKTKQPPLTAKQKVLVTGAKRQLIDDLLLAVRNAGLVADSIMPGLIGPVNAFELAMPEVFAREVVALVDIGFKNSTICLLQEGELILSRVVGIGGDKLTTGLSEAMGIGYAEAEGIKVGMPQEVQPNLETLVTPLGRELRALIDFFEHQQDRQVGHVFVSGGSACSDLILQILQTELLVECKRWNPAAFLQLALPPEQVAEMERVAPQLAVAVGASTIIF